MARCAKSRVKFRLLMCLSVDQFAKVILRESLQGYPDNRVRLDDLGLPYSPADVLPH